MGFSALEESLERFHRHIPKVCAGNSVAPPGLDSLVPTFFPALRRRAIGRRPLRGRIAEAVVPAHATPFALPLYTCNTAVRP
jgi:hypothetical protein